MAIILNDDGRNESVRKDDEVKSILMRDYDALSEEEREVLDIILNEMKKGKVGLLELMSELEYDEPMVDTETWLKEPYYFQKCHNLWPKLIDDMIELFSGDYHEVILSGSLGWGKSYFAKVAMCRVIYEVSCLRDPQRSFGIAPESTLAIAGLSVSEKIAKKVLMEDIQKMLNQSPYFMEKFKPKMTQTELRFPKKVWMTAASTAQNSVIGLDLFSAILDECVVGNTMIMLADGSEIAIKELMNNPKLSIMTFDEDSQKLKTTTDWDITCKGEMNVYEIELENGMILECSWNHKWLVRRNDKMMMVMTIDIKEDDDLVSKQELEDAVV